MKTIIPAFFAAVLITFVSCGPSAEEQEKTQQDMEEKVEDIFKEIEASMEEEGVEEKDTTQVEDEESGEDKE